MLDRSPVVRSPRAQHSFRFENAWKLEPSFNDMIKESCLFYNDQSILNHLGRCAKDIYSWSLDHCNSLKKNIDECHKKKIVALEAITQVQIKFRYCPYVNK